MILRTAPGAIVLFLLLTGSIVAQDDDSLAGSFLSGLLDSITSTANSADCPGVCVHAFATLICFEVLEHVQCPTSMRCCIEAPINGTGTSSENLLEDDSPTSTMLTTVKMAVTSVNVTTPPPSTTPVTTSSMAPLKTTSDNQVETVNKTSTKTCSGICMAERIADYCDAVLVIDTLCKPGYKCCVSRDAFGDSPPPELLVIDRTNSSRFDEKTGISTLHKSSSPSTTARPNTSITSTSVSTTALITTVAATKQSTTTIRPKITPKKPCKGECVSGFFALLCDKVDGEAECPDDGSCCIIDAFLKTETTTTIRPTTKSPQPKLQPCPGFCLLTIMAAFCERPNVIIPKTSSCQSGSICCDNTKTTPQTPRPRPKPTPRPPVTTVLLPPDPRPECPGSCIVSYLSFTCFRNAELTNLFKCKKQGHQCCAPKSLIREFSGGNSTEPVLTNRNDTMYVTSRPYTTPLTTMMYETTTMTTTMRSPVYSKYVCGVKGTSRGPVQARSLERGARVVGGEDADANEWCWQVALINSLNQYLCGGALIGTQWVLTAAHCVTNIVRSGDAIYVRVGDHDLTRKYGSPGAQTLRVATTYIHHNHNSQTLDNDIALLKLHGQAELKDGVCLVCLPARGVSHTAGKRCTVTGYGYMGEAGPIPLRVREAEIPIVSDAECIRKVNAVTEKIFILPASSFCAGGEQGNDACQGDGGGPLVCQDDGFYELAGLVSWGFGCGRLDVPGVYVKVSAFIGWINQIISL
ncbi:trypsin-like serine protease domain-containing protein masquerade isoform X2 [Nomia melanderi]|uniref:trypsin-like serine protease domain-containing protein masquerade isoform X2 n=1 Tax=Nomia melanderi TaxID=2448451 RepID=UPI003FCC8F9C